MNKELTEISQNMAEEKYDGSVPNRRSLIRAYLAGFEARDGMDGRLREEHAEMFRILQTVVLMRNIRIMFPSVHEEIKSLITKIETNGNN